MPIRIIWSTDGLLCLSSATTSFWHSDAVRGPSTPTASQQSPQACASSSTSIRPPHGSEPYLREDHFSGGRPGRNISTTPRVSLSSVQVRRVVSFISHPAPFVYNRALRRTTLDYARCRFVCAHGHVA